MSPLLRRLSIAICLLVCTAPFTFAAEPQSAGTAGTVTVTVNDPTGAVIPGAEVKVHNPVSGFSQSAVTDQSGQAILRNLPFNNYHLSIEVEGFGPAAEDVVVQSSVPVALTVKLAVASQSQTMTVEAGSADLIEVTPVAHTDVTISLASKVPSESVTSGMSSMITETTPGVAADSNGFFHPLGEHADTTFSIDSQPISDQQSRVYSNQLSLDAVQSMEVINGAPPAEFGDKSSLVARITTKSGLGVARPTGSVSVGYGSFGTSNLDFNLAMGNQEIGNFFSASGLNSGRFLDSPEFVPLHDHGNAEGVFDRVDYQLTNADTLHLNLWASRSWFQTPNDYDQQAAGQDQRQQIRSFNVAPSYTHLFGTSLLLSANAYVRQDRAGYFPSADPFHDLPATMSEQRRLTNAGIRTDLSYVKGMHNIKTGIALYHTFLSEDFRLGLTDPAYNPVCLTGSGAAVSDPSYTDPVQCSAAGFVPNPGFQPGLLPYDLTRGGSRFGFAGRTDIKQVAGYVQDAITWRSWNFNLGLRAESYRGLSQGSALEPRLGAAYNIRRTGTVLRASYARVFETPYNENLILSSSTGAGGLATGVGAFGLNPLQPGIRNQFNAGFQQAFGRYLVVDGEYFWKFTKPDFDFDVLFNTSLTFPIEWQKSKIDGMSLRVSMPNYRGWTAYAVMGHARSRFFAPEVGGLLFNSPLATGPFRIDHDQAFQQTTHVQYQFAGRYVPWVGFNWSYESGLVAGSVPDYATALTLTADQQQQIGLYCGSTLATLGAPITSCSSPVFGATRVRIPAAGTENDDTNPPRIAPRHLFDLAAGVDNLFHADRYRTSLRFEAVNLTNKVALYNFLSTFSGTHFVTPRSYQATMTFHF